MTSTRMVKVMSWLCCLCCLLVRLIAPFVLCHPAHSSLVDRWLVNSLRPKMMIGKTAKGTTNRVAYAIVLVMRVPVSVKTPLMASTVSRRVSSVQIKYGGSDNRSTSHHMVCTCVHFLQASTSSSVGGAPPSCAAVAGLKRKSSNHPANHGRIVAKTINTTVSDMLHCLPGRFKQPRRSTAYIAHRVTATPFHQHRSQKKQDVDPMH